MDFRQKNGITLNHGDHHVMTFDDKALKYTLTIMGAYADDSGEYACVAKNNFGSASSTCSVKITGIF